MDQGLFTKYGIVVKEQTIKKEEIITFVQQETGAQLLPEEIILKKNILSFQTSSVKNVLLKRKVVQDFLKQKGYQSK